MAHLYDSIGLSTIHTIFLIYRVIKRLLTTFRLSCHLGGDLIT
jgi:hypothetical protein